MKKSLLISVILIFFVNLSYASFPVSNALTINQDTIKKETIEEYNIRLQKMGFDVDVGSNSKTLKDPNASSIRLFITGGVLILLATLAFLISMLDAVECINRTETCNNSGVGYLGASLILFVLGILSFIMGVVFWKRNKKKEK